MANKIKFKIKKSDVGFRLDHFLVKKISNLSRSKVQKKIKDGRILVNQEKTKANHQLNQGDNIIVDLNLTPKAKKEKKDIKLDIIYENSDVIVINKPAGLVVHPAYGHKTDTLIDNLLNKIKFKNKNFSERTGIVHRLDKDTSGVLIIAKTENTHNHLVEQFKKQKVVKTYLALIKGNVKPKKGIIDSPICRNPTNRQKMTVCLPGEGKDALTEYKVLKYLHGFTLIEVKPKTGRTHQIRVHLSSIGHPVVGDKVYGGRHSQKVPHQFLHAYSLKIKLPKGETKEFKADLPYDLQKILSRLSKKQS